MPGAGCGGLFPACVLTRRGQAGDLSGTLRVLSFMKDRAGWPEEQTYQYALEASRRVSSGGEAFRTTLRAGACRSSRILGR
jgi:hypothetical protein